MALFLEAVLEEPSNLLVKERLNESSLKSLDFRPAVEIYLFGSRSRNTHRPNSDVDLLVIMDKQRNSIDESTSIFHYKYKKKLEKAILNILGNNPYNHNKPFEIDLVGNYELRFFDLDTTLLTAVKLNILKHQE